MTERVTEDVQELDKSDDGSKTSQNLVKRSPVHTHFTFVEETNKYSCNYCKKSFKKELRSSTGNLMKHLRSQHVNKLSESQEKTNPALPGPLIAAFNKSVCEKDLVRKIVEFIIMTNQSFSVVEEYSFRVLLTFCKTTTMKIPQRETIKAKIQSMYEEKREEIKMKLQAQPGKISLVVDCWSSRKGQSFHGILATYIDANWNYQQVILDFDILQGSHKGKYLAKSIYDELCDYGIKNKLLAITSDNASNMNTMFSELAKLLQPVKTMTYF